MNTREPRSYLQNKTSYLYAWNFRDKAAWLVDMDREDFYQSSFLDQRIIVKNHDVRSQPIDRYLNRVNEQRIGNPAFIFHTAFCCSTLLARSLDFPGQTMVFREPLTLLQLADLKRGLSQSDQAYDLLLEKTLQSLLNSSFSERRVVIKPTNLANNLLPDLIAIAPSAKFLLLHDELEPFMISVLKRPEESATGIQHFLNRFLLDNPMEDRSLLTQTRGKLHYQAALAWALQKRYLNNVLESNAASIRTIQTPRLLEEPTNALASISEWLALDLDSQPFSDIVTTPVWNRNAKHPGKRYDPEQRAREQASLRLRFASAVDDATQWLNNGIRIMPEAFPDQSELKFEG